LIATFYLTSAVFIFVVLGAVCAYNKINMFKFFAYIKDELLLVLGTSSSEPALPHLMRKLEKAGCSENVVGLVLPMGYSFNLDGINIYMTLSALFIAQALNIELTLSQELGILLVAVISSKGAAGVTGAGFIILASTLSTVGTVPVAGMALILGIDRFMSECRALTSFIGNAVATVAIANSVGEVDMKRFNDVIYGRIDVSGDTDSHNISESEGGVSVPVAASDIRTFATGATGDLQTEVLGNRFQSKGNGVYSAKAPAREDA
jgi:aerobic C4-dicarboxylate transport protein